MATISEASDINIVLRYLLQKPRPGLSAPTNVEALDAAARLADRSYKALSAGLSALDVHAAWPHRRGTAPDA